MSQTTELFKDLSVQFHWAESPIYDIDGNRLMSSENPSSTGLYESEDAYKFLAAMARYDKELYTEGHQKVVIEPKFKIELMSPVFGLTMEIHIGDLELGNMASVVDGFEKRVLNYFTEEERIANTAEYRQKISDLIPDVQNYFASLKQEETQFLEKNPAFREYNEYKADTYKYLVKKSLLNSIENGEEKALYFDILNIADISDETLAIMNMQERGWHSSSKIYSTDEIEGYNKDDYVIVESSSRPEDIFSNSDIYEAISGRGNYSQMNDIKILFSPEELELAHSLDVLKYEKEYVATNPYRDSFGKTDNIELTGFDALRQAKEDYNNNVIPDRELIYKEFNNSEDLRNTSSLRLHPKFAGHFTIDGEEQFFSLCVFSDNQGQLQNKSFVDNFISPERQEKFKKLFAFAGKYYYSHFAMSDKAFLNNDYNKTMDPSDSDFSSKVDLDMELAIHKACHPEIDITKSKLSSYEIDKLADYYRQAVSLRMGDGIASLNACNYRAVQMMIEDGLSNSKINSVFTCLQDKLRVDKEVENVRQPLSGILKLDSIKQLQKEVKQKHTESPFKTKNR